MPDKKKKKLRPEELEKQEAVPLPDREALSIMRPTSAAIADPGYVDPEFGIPGSTGPEDPEADKTQPEPAPKEPEKPDSESNPDGYTLMDR